MRLLPSCVCMRHRVSEQLCRAPPRTVEVASLTSLSLMGVGVGSCGQGQIRLGPVLRQVAADSLGVLCSASGHRQAGAGAGGDAERLGCRRGLGPDAWLRSFGPPSRILLRTMTGVPWPRAVSPHRLANVASCGVSVAVDGMVRARIASGCRRCRARRSVAIRNCWSSGTSAQQHSHAPTHPRGRPVIRH